MFRLPSLSFSYIVSTGTAHYPHMEMMKELEVMEKKVQSVMKTVSELASQLRQMTSREERYYKEEDGDVNPLYITSSSLMQCDGRRQSRIELEAASRLVGEVHLAKPGAKSLVSCNVKLLMDPHLSGQVAKPLVPTFLEESLAENASQRKLGGKGQRFNQEVDHHIGAEDQEEAEKLTSLAVKEETLKHLEEGEGATGLERGKNPVCLLQELLVANNAIHLPKYHLVGEYGPGHSKIFTVQEIVI